MKKNNELNAEEIKSVTDLSTLDDTQINAIINLSKSVVDRTTGGIYDSIDSDLSEVLGKKPDGLKTLAWVAQSVKTASEKVKDYDSISEQVSQLTQKAEADKKAPNATIESLEKQIKDRDDQIALIQKTSESKIMELEEARKNDSFKLINSEIDKSLVSSMKDLKFNESIPESLLKEAIDKRKAEALSKYEVEINDGAILFRHDGEIVRNPENGFNPSTAFDLIKPSITDLLDQKRVVEGLGGKPHKSKGISIGEARTQMQADELISNHLVSLGIERLSDDFVDKQLELRKEMKVSELPVR